MSREHSAEELLTGISDWVNLESPTDQPEHVNRLVDHIEREYASFGMETERIALPGYGDMLQTHLGGEGPGVLVICHLDTVWALGTKKLKVEGDIAYGPGIYDMKAGAFIAFTALRDMVELNIAPKLPITVLYNSDEEIGSPSSRNYISKLANENSYVLVFEPSGPNRAVKTSRSGTARFKIHVSGRASHSGAEHSAGRSAIVQLAQVILELEALTDYEEGTTVNVGVIDGGTRANVVPAEASAYIDIRATTSQGMGRVVAALNGMVPSRDGITIKVEGGVTRDPFERASSEALFLKAKQIAGAHGVELSGVHSGGGSDGNLTAALGVPTLDGLGALGGGTHADNEHVVISELPARVQLATWLLSELS